MNRFAIAFPGQGAQAVGMGKDLADSYASARETFQRANDALGFELDKLCFEGPIEELSRSDVAQPAILTCSIAALRAIEEATGSPMQPTVVAGLSLGEYTALVAADAIEFTDAVKLVRKRGEFMQQACDAAPGTMYAVIGLEDAQVEEACAMAREETGGGIWPANYNCPGQLAISGEAQPSARAAEICTEMGARRAMQLKVAGAFHTPLMQSAADMLEPVLAATDIRQAKCPVVANVTAEPVADPQTIRDLLVKQVTHPVRWTACMQRILADDVGEFYEVGPGKVIAGLLRRADRNASCTNVCTTEQVAALA